MDVVRLLLGPGPLVNNLSIMETVWTATALVAVYFAWVNRREAARARDALEEDEENLIAIASGHLRRETTRIIVGVTFFVVGMMSAFAPPNPNPTVAGLGVAIGLTALSMLLTRDSILDRRDRHKLLRFHNGETMQQTIDREAGESRRTAKATGTERAADDQPGA